MYFPCPRLVLSSFPALCTLASSAPQYSFASHVYCCRHEQHSVKQQSPAAGQQRAAAPAPEPRPQGAAEPGRSKEPGLELQQSSGAGGAEDQAAAAADDKPEHPAK